ncbi:hypothetical protein HDU78_002354 [Chytriomyces hyalinus]|nr:hypothetical protein HDU78_002354 [Chytriomyces hyalinus]
MCATEFSGHVHLLLAHWGVRRIAMIRERNDELGFNGYIILVAWWVDSISDNTHSFPVGADILTTLRAKGIQISAKIDISGKLNEDEAVYAKSLIVNTGTHYVFISGQADFTANTLYRLGKLNITGRDFVFIGITVPSPFGNPMKVFGPDFYNFVQGYVMLAAMPDTSNPQYEQFNKLFHSRIKVNLLSNGSRLSPDFDFVSSYGVDAVYDCTMLMLLGIEQVMKNNPEVDLSMVSKRVLNEQMNFTNFQNLDYIGVLGEPRRLDSNGDVKMPFHFLRYINTSVVLIGTSDSNAGRFEPSQNYTGILQAGFSSLPPDGFTNEFIFATDWQSTLGQIIIGLTCLGYAFCVLSLVFISRFRKNKILRSASIPELVTIVVGCKLGYASLIFYILPHTPYLCTVQLSLIGLGFSVAISTIICKNLMVAKLFAGFHIKFPLEVTRMHRALNCAIVLMGIVIVVIIYRLRGPPLVFEKYSKNGNYFVCVENTQKGSWFLAYTFTFYYGLLFSGLFVALYKSQRILWDCSNESGAIALIILVSAISYAVLSMLSAHVDELTDFRKCICVWIQSSVVLFSVIGSKAWIMFKYEMQRSKVRSLISQLMTRLADREEQAIKSLARLGDDRSRSFGKSGGAISRRSGGSLAGKKKMQVNSLIDRKGVLMYAVLSKTVSKCVYTYQREKSSKSTWCCGECQLFCVCDRMWFLFQSEEITDPFRILDSLEIKDCGNRCLMIQQDAMYTIWLEFESLEIANQFLKELQSALADLKTAQFKFVRQDSVNVIRSVDM